MRASYIGDTSALQADATGSIPVTRSSPVGSMAERGAYISKTGVRFPHGAPQAISSEEERLAYI